MIITCPECDTKYRYDDARFGGADVKQLEESLKRLQVDTIDLWQFHEIAQPNEPHQIYTEGALEVAVKAKERGKIRYIGFTGHRFPDLLGEMIDRGFNVHYLEIHKGWLEIHFPKDIELANELFIAQEHPSEVS